MTPQNIIGELNRIELIVLNLSSHLSEQNRIVMAGTVTKSVTTSIQKEVEVIDKKINLLYTKNKIPDGWLSFDNYKKNIKSYKGIDELDKDIDLVQQIKYWIPQSKAFVELIIDLQVNNETPETFTNRHSIQLANQYINSGSKIDDLKYSLLINLMNWSEVRKNNLKDSVMNNFTINGNVNGQLNVAGHSINSPELQISLAELITHIEKTDAPPSEKASAKSKLQEFLAHPLVAAIVGGLAGNVGS
ncbi:hypothetical protein [Pectobacterium carotovorum]|uniref:hypothetical protein n=1 Tax=Pectobacterium carotovorum TaxID=554 RepID=UPI003820BBF9